MNKETETEIEFDEELLDRLMKNGYNPIEEVRNMVQKIIGVEPLECSPTLKQLLYERYKNDKNSN